MKKVLEHLKYDSNNPKNNKSKNKNNVRNHWAPVPGFKNAIQLSRKPITTDTSSAAITNIENCVWQMHLLLHSRHDFRSLIGVLASLNRYSIPYIICQKVVSRFQRPLQKAELIFDWHMTSIAPTVARTIAATVGATVAPTIASRRFRRSSAQPVAATVASCKHGIKYTAEWAKISATYARFKS